MGNVITHLELETGRKCFDTFRRCLDHERASFVEYDDLERQFMSDQGETVRYGDPRDVSAIAKSWQEREPAFRLFLDGSCEDGGDRGDFGCPVVRFDCNGGDLI